MKKLLGLIIVIACIMCGLVAFGEGANLPEGVKEILSGSSWQAYEIGHVNYGEDLRDYGSNASYYYDQGNCPAAFVVMHSEKQNVLCIFEKKSSGDWYLKEKSSSAVLQNGRIPQITAETYGEFSVAYLDKDTQTDFSVTYKRRSEGWFVSEIFVLDNKHKATSISVYDEKLVFSQETNNWKKTTVNGITACAFDQFSISSFPLTVEKARNSLTLPPDIPSGSLPDPQSIKFTANKKYAVYSGPGEQYSRGANGKAQMSTNDWVQVFGKENEWIMVQYDISKDHMRIGWIPEKALPKNASVNQLTFIYSDAVVIADSFLTDDPLFSQSSLCTILADSTVKYLATMGDWAYIEWNGTNNYKQTRGFVKQSSILNASKEKAISIAREYFLSTDPTELDEPLTETILNRYAIDASYNRDAEKWIVRIANSEGNYWLVGIDGSDGSVIQVDCFDGI